MPDGYGSVESPVHTECGSAAAASEANEGHEVVSSKGYRPLDGSAAQFSIGRIAGIALLFLGTTGLLLGLYTKQTMNPFGPFVDNTDVSAEDPEVVDVEADVDFDFTMERKGYAPLAQFTESDNDFIYSFMKDYDAIVEPYAENALHVLADTDSGDYFKFIVCDKEDKSDCVEGLKYADESESSKDVTITLECSPFQQYGIFVTKYNVEGAEQYTTSGSAVCMYVRREIRSLTPADLDATMDAMYAMWSTPAEAGAEKYGEHFHTATYFAEAHHFNAAWQDGDHIHEGLGFFPQHIKMTNMFELSMQSVDPSITLPYWDFTIESEADQSMVDSFIFTEEVFGTISGPSNGEYWTWSADAISDAAIKDGRWAYISADMNTRLDETLQNSFGYMRGPWNMNPSPNITRFASTTVSVPSCAAYSSWASADSYTDFLYGAPYLPHASVHGDIGGAYGCDAMNYMRSKGLINDIDDQISICSKWGYVFPFYVVHSQTLVLAHIHTYTCTYITKCTCMHTNSHAYIRSPYIYNLL